MINIVFKNHIIEINGHAKYDEYGKDIICASVSAISQTALNWFNKNDIKLNISSGYFYLEVIKLNKDNINKMNLLKIQLASIANEYKNYIKLKGEEYEK